MHGGRCLVCRLVNKWKTSKVSLNSYLEPMRMHIIRANSYLSLCKSPDRGDVVGD